MKQTIRQLSDKLSEIIIEAPNNMIDPDRYRESAIFQIWSQFSKPSCTGVHKRKEIKYEGCKALEVLMLFLKLQLIKKTNV